MATIVQANSVGIRVLQSAPTKTNTASLSILDALPTDAEGKFVGQLKILGLSKLREELGVNWETHRSTIQKAIENIMSRYLGSKDCLIKIREDQFLVVFADTDPEHADGTSQIIADAIRKVLVGDKRPDLIKVEKEIGSVATDKNGKLHISPLKADNNSSASNKNSMTPPRASRPPRTKTSGVSVRQSFKEAVQRAVSAHQAKGKNYDIGYFPIWNMRHEVLVGYAILPTAVVRHGTKVHEHDVLPIGSPESDFIELDLAFLQTQIEMAAELHQNAFTSLLLSQVHYRTLFSQSGLEQVMSIVREIPAFLKKTLMIEVVGLPDGTPPSQVAQKVGAISSYFAAVTIRLPRLDYPVADCVEMKAAAVAYKLPRQFKESVFLPQAKRLIQEAKKARLMTSFEYAPSIKVAALLKQAGAVFASGDFLGGPYDVPGNMKAMTVKQVRNGETAPF